MGRKTIFYWEENASSTGKKKQLSEISDAEISVFQRYTFGRHEHGASGEIGPDSSVVSDSLINKYIYVYIYRYTNK